MRFQGIDESIGAVALNPGAVGADVAVSSLRVGSVRYRGVGLIITPVVGIVWILSRRSIVRFLVAKFSADIGTEAITAAVAFPFSCCCCFLVVGEGGGGATGSGEREVAAQGGEFDGYKGTH